MTAFTPVSDPRMTRCRVCQRSIRRPLFAPEGLIFCPEHQREFKLRRARGVTGSQLSSAWGDRLDNWRDRPSELDGEIKPVKGASPLVFSGREDEWLLFQRNYSPSLSLWQLVRAILFLPFRKPLKSTAVLQAGKGRPNRAFGRSRASDILAVHAQTGEIRRFVDVTEQEVREDLSGQTPLSDQAHLTNFWGDPRSTGRRERAQNRFRQRTSPGGRPDLTALAEMTTFPFYGPVSPSLDLTLAGTGLSTKNNRSLDSISLTFISPSKPEAESHFEVTTMQASAFPAQESEAEVQLRDRQFLFRSLPLTQRRLYLASSDVAVEEPFVPPAIWQGDVVIDGQTFSGSVRSWTEPRLLARYQLSNGEVRLAGSSTELGRDELFSVFADLHALNQRPEVLKEYQRELDTRIERLRTGKQGQ